MLGTFWWHSGSILVAFWEHSGSILGAFSEHSGSTLGAFWEHSGSVLGAFWEAPGRLNAANGVTVGRPLRTILVLKFEKRRSKRHPKIDAEKALIFDAKRLPKRCQNGIQNQ